MKSPHILSLCLIGWLLQLQTTSIAKAQDEDDEFRPGLVAEYRSGARAVTRIDSDVTYAWDDAAPDARISANQFDATWRGLMLIRQEARVQFHALVQGEVLVEFDGRTVLKGATKSAQWVSGEPLTPGLAERPLVVTFRKTEKTAQLKLFWSSDVFGMEPIPAELLFHDATSFNSDPLGSASDREPTDERASQRVAVKRAEEVALIERGRQQFVAFRCGRCHVREGDSLAPAAPSLQHAAVGMTAEQIAKRLAPALNSPDATALNRRMPHFRLNDEQVRYLAAFLMKQSEPVKLDEAKTIKPKTPKEGEVVVTSVRRGELLLRSVGCLACHRIGDLGNSNELPFAGPDLTYVSQRRSASWLTTWLADPQRVNADHRMPVFALTDEERHLIVMSLMEPKPTGEPTAGNNASLNRDPLESAADRKSSDEHSPPRVAVKRDGDFDAGRQLFEQLRCAACHRVSDKKLTEFARAKSDLSQPITDWSQGCMAEGREQRGEATVPQLSTLNSQPNYSLGLDAAAIKAFLASRWNVKLSPNSQFVRGQRILEERNCFACHPRHGGLGLGRTAKLVASADKDLNGQAPALVAPSLNAVGDKLLDEALSIAVRGERQPIRMPWLKVRMPRFKHSPDEMATLTRYFVEHDRIPAMPSAQANGGRQPPGASEPARTPTSGLTPTVSREAADAATHLAGQALTGVRGWSCIACHKIGDYEPKQVALGARGSDLKMLGKHLRPEFFFRWIASPLRVIPGVEMPQFNRPVAGVLDGNLSKQHAALWQALNDPNFQPPTNPANVEQLWVVNPDERPRVVRDVFQLPKELGGNNVSRGFAVGFDNGHSLLFDAETASVKQWTFGDFARQQVIGKRWFWQMAGVDVLRSVSASQFGLRRVSDPTSPVWLPSRRSPQSIGDFRVGRNGILINYRLHFAADEKPWEGGRESLEVAVEETLRPIKITIPASENGAAREGIERRVVFAWLPERNAKQLAMGGADEIDVALWFGRPASPQGVGEPSINVNPAGEWQRLPGGKLDEAPWEWTSLRPGTSLIYSAVLWRQDAQNPARPSFVADRGPVSSVPGFNGQQLPLDRSIMPTGFVWRSNGELVFSSLKGHVFAAVSSKNDGQEDRLKLIQEGLSAPYGVVVLNERQLRKYFSKDDWTLISQVPAERTVVVASRQDLALLTDLDGDGYCESQLPVSRGWGLNDDYHEWTTSPVIDSKGRLFFGLSSDYTDKNRSKDLSRWRGKVLLEHLVGSEPVTNQNSRREQADRLLPSRQTISKPISHLLTPYGHAFRYPTGIAINERNEVFVSDQQGVQNCFNEINYLVEGAHYGVPSTHEEDKDAPETKAAIQIPHPWTRSVNGLCFLTGNEGYPDLKGHGIGCEYNGRFLIRFTTQRVGDVMQGAVFPFSLTDEELNRRTEGVSPLVEGKSAADATRGLTPPLRQQANFEGPLCCGVSPKGEIYIGSIADSGWAGGQNTGSIVKLKGNGQRPNGIREIRATRDGFDIDFFEPVDQHRATNPEHYSISGYTRVWGGAYATPDSDRHRCKVLAVELSADGKTAKLKVDPRKTPNYVYEISCREVSDSVKEFFPAYGFYTLHRIPTEVDQK